MPAKKRIFRVSLRALLLVTTITCIVMGLESKRVRLQKQAVDWIGEHNGRIVYEDYLPRALRGLRGPLGDHYFRAVTEVRLAPGSGIVNDISLLANLESVEYLGLQNNYIYDLTPLANLTKLRTLTLSDNVIYDVSPLANLTELERLDILSNRISDLRPLRRLRKLKVLHAEHNWITDVTPLAGLPALTTLGLTGNRITDPSPLKRLAKTLQTLDLTVNRIDGEQADGLRTALPGTTISLTDASQWRWPSAAGDK